MVTQGFKDAVELKNVRRVRIMMKDSLLLDKTFQDFDEMSRYAQSHGLSIYDNSLNYQIKEDRSLWTESYLNELLAALVNNFHNTLISHIKAVIIYLYPQASRSSKAGYGSRSSTGGSGYSHGQKVAIGCAAGCVVGGAIGAVTAEYVFLGIFMGVIVGGVIGGVGSYLLTNNK